MPARSARNLFYAGSVILIVLAVAAVTAVLTVVGRTDRPANSAASTGTGSPSPSSSPSPTPPPSVLAPAGAGSPVPTVQGLAHSLQSALADPALGGTLRAAVMDAATGRVLLDHDAASGGTPASTTKILTSTAALATISPDFRFTTRIVQGSQPGQIVVIGGGDPTLTAATGSTAPSYPGAARLSALADQVQQATKNPVTRIVIDDSRFTGPDTGPGWESDDISGGYVSTIVPFMVDGGRRRPGYTPRSPEPDLAAGQTLAADLGNPGATVTRGTAPAGARVLATVHSAPITTILSQMLSVSDNLLAEMVGRQVARASGLPASFAGADQAIERALRSLHVDTTGLTLSDCSGLSRNDRIAPTTLVQTLRQAATGPPRLRPLLPDLPVAGYAGTLADRYRQGSSTAGAGRVRAKTGTLTGVSSLAGVVQDADGRLLVFALLADNVSATGTLDAEAALDDVAATLARCGCR